MSIKCPKCGAPLDNSSCDYCGYVPQSSLNTTSSNHQSQTEIQQVTAENQTTHIQFQDAAVSKKSRWLALILCYLFGYVGVHLFYVGKTKTGILYLCTMGLFGVGWIVDIIRITTGTFNDDQNLPLKK